MTRGRPVKSEVRQNIIEILNFMGKGYGYELHKIYNELFPQCTRENIYYNLRKGVLLGEFEVKEVKREKGEFSWGDFAEKTYYILGANAKPKGDERAKKFFEGRKLK